VTRKENSDEPSNRRDDDGDSGEYRVDVCECVDCWPNPDRQIQSGADSDGRCMGAAAHCGWPARHRRVLGHAFSDPVGKRPTKPMGLVGESDGKTPLQSWAAEQRKVYTDSQLDPKGHIENLDPQTRCLPTGVPRFDYASPYNGHQFLQKPGYVVMFSEWNHLYRIIPLDGRPHLGSNIKLYMGDSRGHWEGNTLIVDVTNFTDKTWFDMVGTFHSDALHVVERFTPVDADTIEYEATIEDPKVFTRPWKVAGVFNSARNIKDYQLYEYACLEGDHAPENIVGRDVVDRIYSLSKPLTR
jgi:hypothetical protein